MTAGQPLMTLMTDTPERFDRALAALEGSWSLGEEHTPSPLILDRL